MKQDSIKHYPNAEVAEYGSEIQSSLMTANIQHALGGDMGGCKPLDMADYPQDHHPYIESYIENGMNSLALTYAAMRNKEQELDEAKSAKSDGYLFWVVMQKRGDGKVYPDLHKCLPTIFFSKEEAEAAIAADPALAEYRHAVGMVGVLASTWNDE